MKTELKFAFGGALLGAVMTLSQPASAQIGLGGNCVNDSTVTIGCDADNAVVRAGQTVTLTANGGSGLRWMWRADNGRIFGSGGSVRFDTTGLAPGRYDVVLLGRGASGCGVSRCVRTIEVASCPDLAINVDRTSVTSGETLTFSAAGYTGGAAYTWTASGGRLTPAGTSATLDTTGSDSGTIVVRVNAVDAECNAAQEVAISVVRPQALPPSLLNFNDNESRLDNEDKAQLDDVVIRAGQDITARVVVVGSSRAGERAGVARRRAERTRDYLINEKGIDPSRVEIRSQESAPQGSVQVYIVPPGAQVPTA
jgi:outer membrane protein OmpA-like peptidoglycan-associated protein